MGHDWDDVPKWRKQGRTGPGPAAPRYSSRRDRATVRRGGKPGKPPEKKCCPMVEAGRAVRRGRFRLARRYALLSLRLIAKGA
jgi:hypothetical protein